jgi:hypothetical protein
MPHPKEINFKKHTFVRFSARPMFFNFERPRSCIFYTHPNPLPLEREFEGTPDVAGRKVLVESVVTSRATLGLDSIPAEMKGGVSNFDWVH